MEKQKLLLEMKIKKNKVCVQVKLNIVRKSVKKSYVIKNVNLEKKAKKKQKKSKKNTKNLDLV